MTRPVRRAAACLLTGLLASSGAVLAATPTAQAANGPTSPAPLRVTIDQLTPSTVPANGPVTLTGTVTNRSATSWTNLKAYLFTSSTPMTSAAELTDASQSDPAAVVGSRIVDPRLSDPLSDLAPGASATYTLSVPRRDLRIPSDEGVYWIGVHVLGSEGNGQDNVADGRARTFIPLVSNTAPGTTLSLVMPVQGAVRRTPDGRISNVAAWRRTLAPDGRLDRLLNLSGTASQPFTWVVDPSVVDAARSLADGNPPIDTGPTTSPAGGSTGASGSASPSPRPSSSASPDAGDNGSGSSSNPAERDAADWIAELTRQAGSHAVMQVPYGALDVAAAYTHGFGRLVHQAIDLSTQTMTGVDIRATTLVAPSDGYLPAKALSRLPAGQPVLLADAAVPTATQSVLRRSAGGRPLPPLILTDSSASSGGPPPGRRYDALAVRQRVLSEAALHAMSPQRGQPLVVTTPDRWNPGQSWREAQFFGGLTVPWLRMVDLPQLLGRAARSPGAARVSALEYPAAARRAQLPVANLAATRRLRRTGTVFASLLDRNQTVDDQLAKTAMLGSSTLVRPHPRPAAARVRATTAVVRSQMHKVHIEGPLFVILSSESGTFQVTVINDLDEAVHVGIKAKTGTRKLRIQGADPVLLGPGQRASVQLRASSRNIGVHAVTLMPVNAAGQPLGNLVRFNVRSSQVGLVIWVIMGVGAAVLFVAIAIRLGRRVRRRKATHGPLLKAGRL